jgi:hypothetical protein
MLGRPVAAANRSTKPTYTPSAARDLTRSCPQRIRNLALGSKTGLVPYLSPFISHSSCARE